jgi:hypothetical protein
LPPNAGGDKGLTAGFANLSCNSFGFSCTTAVDEDRRTFLSETFGDTFTDAAGTASD